MTEHTISERALLVFSAILREGNVFAVHNGEETQLKTIAVAGDKLVGIVGTNSGGVKTIDVTNDEIVRVLREVVLEAANPDDEE